MDGINGKKWKKKIVEKKRKKWKNGKNAKVMKKKSVDN